MILIDYLHQNVKTCEHCGYIFGSDDDIPGFNEKSFLCADCGVQNLYDTRFSKETCCICLDSIGYGHFAVLCRDTKHKIHLGCVREQILCPMCRCSNESDYDEESDED